MIQVNNTSAPAPDVKANYVSRLVKLEKSLMMAYYDLGYDGIQVWNKANEGASRITSSNDWDDIEKAVLSIGDQMSMLNENSYKSILQDFKVNRRYYADDANTKRENVDTYIAGLEKELLRVYTNNKRTLIQIMPMFVSDIRNMKRNAGKVGYTSTY